MTIHDKRGEAITEATDRRNRKNKKMDQDNIMSIRNLQFYTSLSFLKKVG